MIQVPVHIHLTLAFRLATLEVELSVVSLPHWTERSLSPEIAGLELMTLAGVKRSAKAFESISFTMTKTPDVGEYWKRP